MSEPSLQIPRRLNDPPRIFWWDFDVALLWLSCMLAGLLIGAPFTGAALGTAAGWAWGRARAGAHPAYALHLLYWHLPAGISGLKRTPPSHLRRLIG
jgi:conjugal transfer pilus assembly protein TraL